MYVFFCPDCACPYFTSEPELRSPVKCPNRGFNRVDNSNYGEPVPGCNASIETKAKPGINEDLRLAWSGPVLVGAWRTKPYFDLSVCKISQKASV